MQIAIDYTSALTQGGGIARYTREAVSALARLDTPHRYTLVYTKEAADGRPALPPHFAWRELPVSARQAAIVWQRMRLPLPVDRWIGPVDVYHSPDFTLPPLSRARGIVTVHDLSFLATPQYHDPALQRYLAAAVPRAVSHAQHILADSEHTRVELVARLATPPEKISVVYPGVDPRFRPLEWQDPQDDALLQRARAAYGLDNPFILTVGTIEPRKNHEAIIRAYALLHREGAIEHELVVAGGGGWQSTKESLLRLVDDLRLGGDVLFPGFVSDELLPALYNLAALVVYPSHYEGFGLPVLEALACGTPVLTARNTSLPEAGGDVARYVDNSSDVAELAAAIHTALSDETLREQSLRDGPAHAAGFTWEHTARSLLNVYERVGKA
ncbi:MAG TPA: glycosyltransferase family 1 protein [Ardenticatenaceae bacterium]|nr:glycosyltransferase family 1 protein [Ardenticatenaceae bacterium]